MFFSAELFAVHLLFIFSNVEQKIGKINRAKSSAEKKPIYA